MTEPKIEMNKLFMVVFEDNPEHKYSFVAVTKEEVLEQIKNSEHKNRIIKSITMQQNFTGNAYKLSVIYGSDEDDDWEL
jgi:hypothetical protein